MRDTLPIADAIERFGEVFGLGNLSCLPHFPTTGEL